MTEQLAGSRAKARAAPGSIQATMANQVL